MVSLDGQDAILNFGTLIHQQSISGPLFLSNNATIHSTLRDRKIGPDYIGPW